MFQEVLGCFIRYSKNNDLSHILKESGDEESVLLLFLLYFCCFFLFFFCLFLCTLFCEIDMSVVLFSICIL